MKIKVYVVDFELSPITKRAIKVAAAALPVAALAFGVVRVVQAGPPNGGHPSPDVTFSAGSVLRAQDLNTALVQAAPPGVVAAFAGSAVPTGWVACDGSAQDGSAGTPYAELYAAIGTIYGNGGGGPNQFNVPNYQGVFLRGAGSQVVGGNTYSATLGTSQTDLLANHTHPSYAASPGQNLASGPFYYAGAQGSGAFNSATGPQAGGGSETRPANYAVIYIIKL